MRLSNNASLVDPCYCPLTAGKGGGVFGVFGRNPRLLKRNPTMAQAFWRVVFVIDWIPGSVGSNL